MNSLICCQASSIAVKAKMSEPSANTHTQSLKDAHAFYNYCVVPTVEAFRNDFGCVGKGVSAILVTDALAGRIFYHSQIGQESFQNDSQFRSWLSDTHVKYQPLFELAKAVKHGKLTRNSPLIFKSAESIESRPLGFGEAAYGSGRYGSPGQVVVRTESGNLQYVESIVNDGLDVLREFIQ